MATLKILLYINMHIMPCLLSFEFLIPLRALPGQGEMWKERRRRHGKREASPKYA